MARPMSYFSAGEEDRIFVATEQRSSTNATTTTTATTTVADDFVKILN